MRLTTDKPIGNVENAMNLFYIKNRETWARKYGPGPDYLDCTLNDYFRRLIKSYKADIEASEDDTDFSMEMTELLWMFDTEEIEGLLANYYAAAWAFSELREKLKRFEDQQEAGTLVNLPCKIGDTVYRICGPRGRKHASPREVSNITLRRNGEIELFTTTDDILGKTVFLTEEEAREAADKINGKTD